MNSSLKPSKRIPCALGSDGSLYPNSTGGSIAEIYENFDAEGTKTAAIIVNGQTLGFATFGFNNGRVVSYIVQLIDPTGAVERSLNNICQVL